MTNKKVHFQIDGLLKLEQVGDYLNLVGKKVKLVFKKKEPVLNTRFFFTADVVDLSETGTHLVLRNVHIKKYLFFSTHIKKCIVPLDTISTVRILEK